MGRRKINAQIQREQIQLLKVQKELKDILGRINETINELKVEELQLKSNAVAALSESNRLVASTAGMDILELPSTSAKAAELAETQTFGVMQDLDTLHINQQEIDLNITTGQRYQCEEEEDDD